MNLSIKDVPEDVAARLRARAAKNHRSLQGELMAIVCSAAHDGTPSAVVTAGMTTGMTTSITAGAESAGGSVLQGWKTVDLLLAERRARGWAPSATAGPLPLAVDIVRADRDGTSDDNNDGNSGRHQARRPDSH